MTATLRAGAGRARITPPVGRPMAGYIRREGPAESVGDDLQARVLVLDDGVTRLAVVTLDLLYATDALTRRVRRRATTMGFAEDDVMVLATHTHSGPGLLAGERDPELLDAIADGAYEALRAAASALRPASMLLGTAQVPGVARNRRDPGEACDETVRVLALVDGEDRTTIATLVEFACHPTVLEHDTRAYSGDFAGATCRTLEALVGGVALFAQGCAADVNPVFLEHTHRECARIGMIVGCASAQVVAELVTLLAPARTINLSWNEELTVDAAGGGRLVACQAIHAVTVEATVRPQPPADVRRVAQELADVRAQAHTADASQRRALGPRLGELWALELRASKRDQLEDLDPLSDPTSIAVQGFRLGAGLVLLALPGEPFTSTGARLRQAAQDDLLVAGYANQSVGYLPPAEEVPRQGYEVGRAVFAAGSAERVAEAARRVLTELGAAR